MKRMVCGFWEQNTRCRGFFAQFQKKWYNCVENKSSGRGIKGAAGSQAAVRNSI